MTNTTAWICTEGCLDFIAFGWIAAAVITLFVSALVYSLAILPIERYGKELAQSEKLILFTVLFVLIGSLMYALVRYYFYA